MPFKYPTSTYLHIFTRLLDLNALLKRESGVTQSTNIAANYVLQVFKNLNINIFLLDILLGIYQITLAVAVDISEVMM